VYDIKKERFDIANELNSQLKVMNKFIASIRPFVENEKNESVAAGMTIQKKEKMFLESLCGNINASFWNGS
jgi:hypothetical protein